MYIIPFENAISNERLANSFAEDAQRFQLKSQACRETANAYWAALEKLKS